MFLLVTAGDFTVVTDNRQLAGSALRPSIIRRVYPHGALQLGIVQQPQFDRKLMEALSSIRQSGPKIRTKTPFTVVVVEHAN